jgi:hypothetical protein
MSMVRGKVRVGELVQGVVRLGARTTLRFDGDKVVDALGKEVPTERVTRGSLKASKPVGPSAESDRSPK